METLTKQQLRTGETRAKLLAAAERLFVRDGYEGAQLDEIAAEAGRSKGAVYTHFKSKEDLFLALFEHRTKSHVERLAGDLRKCANRKQSMAAFRSFYTGLARDTAWPILTLEFKLFALRHPESKERLRKSFEMSKTASDGKMSEQMFGEVGGRRKAEIETALATLGPVVCGLMLESHFEPRILSEAALRQVLGRIFDALFQSGVCC